MLPTSVYNYGRVIRHGGLKMEMQDQHDATRQNGYGFASSWGVTAPPTSLCQSALLGGMPVLYQQSSISSLLFVAAPQQSRANNSTGGGQFKKNLLFVPTQLLMPDGGIALGMPPSSFVPGSGSQLGSGSGRGEGGSTEESRMSALRSSELAVLLSESPEAQVRSRRSRLLLLIAILLSLQYISVFAILQGKDTPPIFLPKLFVEQAMWEDVISRAQYIPAGPPLYYAHFRHNFYVVALCPCLLLPLLLFVSVVEQKRQMERVLPANEPRLGFRALIPSTALSIAVVVFTLLTLCHSIFVVRTYFDIMVLVLFTAIRYTLNRLNYTCFSPRLMLTKAGNNL